MLLNRSALNSLALNAAPATVGGSSVPLFAEWRASASTSATLDTIKGLSALVSGAAAATSVAATVVVKLEAAAAFNTAAAAALSATKPHAGAAVAAVTAVAGLAAAKLLGTDCSISCVGSASAIVARALTAASTSTAGVVGAVSIEKALSATASSTLQVGGAPDLVKLLGAGGSLLTVSVAALDQNSFLQGAAAGTSASTAQPAVNKNTAGSAVLTAISGGAVTVTGYAELRGGASVLAASAAEAKVLKTLTVSTPQGVASTAANLGLSTPLTGSSTTSASTNSSLFVSRPISLGGALAAGFNGIGTLNATKPLSGAGSSEVRVALLTVSASKLLSAAATCATSASVEAFAIKLLEGKGSTSLSIQALASVAPALTGQGAGSAYAQGNLFTASLAGLDGYATASLISGAGAVVDKPLVGGPCVSGLSATYSNLVKVLAGSVESGLATSALLALENAPAASAVASSVSVGTTSLAKSLTGGVSLSCAAVGTLYTAGLSLLRGSTEALCAASGYLEKSAPISAQVNTHLTASAPALTYKELTGSGVSYSVGGATASNSKNLHCAISASAQASASLTTYPLSVVSGGAQGKSTASADAAVHKPVFAEAAAALAVTGSLGVGSLVQLGCSAQAGFSVSTNIGKVVGLVGSVGCSFTVEGIAETSCSLTGESITVVASNSVLYVQKILKGTTLSVAQVDGQLVRLIPVSFGSVLVNVRVNNSRAALLVNSSRAEVTVGATVVGVADPPIKNFLEAA